MSIPVIRGTDAPPEARRPRPRLAMTALSVTRAQSESWWSYYDQGTGGRPKPGTRVLLRDGRAGTVTAYEGGWKAVTFPVRIDRTGQTLMLLLSEVTVLVVGAESDPAANARHAG